MEFRRLKGAELEKILQMNVDFRSGFADRGAARRFLETEHCWIYAALRKDAIIGFAYGYALSRLDGKADMLYIHEVGVAEPEQRRGVGSAMLTALLRDAGRSGIGRVFLFADRHNTAANALYRKLGGVVGWDSGGDDTVYFFTPDDTAARFERKKRE